MTNDARADAVLLDLAHSTVYVSTGQSFVQADTFKQAIPLGERGNFFADVTGDGLDDAIIVNNQQWLVHPSLGSNFSQGYDFSTGPVSGGN